MHYKRLAVHGNVNIVTTMRGKYKNFIDAFNDLYVIDQNNCWNWQGTISLGYGLMCINNKKIFAHRFSFSHFKHEIPKGMFICHHCDNPKCVNPEHLFCGTYLDNINDRHIKGRDPGFSPGAIKKGEEQGHSKLKEYQVLEIIRMIKEGNTNVELASVFNISRQTINSIRTGKNWKHIPR